MLNVWGGDSGLPLLRVPRLLSATTVTAVVPLTFGLAVYVSVPAESTAGCTANRAGLAAVTWNVTVLFWCGPAEMLVAQPVTFCCTGAALSRIIWSAPLVKLGG